MWESFDVTGHEWTICGSGVDHHHPPTLDRDATEPILYDTLLVPLRAGGSRRVQLMNEGLIQVHNDCSTLVLELMHH